MDLYGYLWIYVDIYIEFGYLSYFLTGYVYIWFILILPMGLRIEQAILDSQPCSSDAHLIRSVPDLSHWM